jgi:hypothetical protein
MFSRSTILLAAASAAVGIGLGLGGPAVHANTILLQDTFGGTGIAHPPWTTTTANGGTISEGGGALNVGLAPASGEAAYVSASDGVGLLNSTATSVTYNLQADINFANMVVNTSLPNGGDNDVITLFKLVNSTNPNAIAQVSISYTYTSLRMGLSGQTGYSGNINPGTVNLTPTTFANHLQQVWDLQVTATNNGSSNWTLTDTLTVTSGITTLASLTGKTTATSNPLNWNPIADNNTVSLGDVSHTYSTSALSGSYSISNFSDTLVGGSSIPEPATLALMAVMGTGLLLVGRKRKVA